MLARSADIVDLFLLAQRFLPAVVIIMSALLGWGSIPAGSVRPKGNSGKFPTHKVDVRRHSPRRDDVAM